jgi:hypothetical protein
VPPGGRRRRYLRENAKKLSVVACESDPAAALTALATSVKPNAKRLASESRCLKRRKWRKR